MSGLVLKLAPKERILINGAVIENGDRRSRLSIMTPNANILRLRDAIHPGEVTTPVRRVCYIAQPQDIGIGCHDRQPRPAVAVFDHRAVDQDPLCRGEFQNKTAHSSTPSRRRPRMMALLMSISAVMLAPPVSTRLVYLATKLARA